MGDACGALGVLAGDVAAQVHGGGAGAVAVDLQLDGLRLGQVLLQWNVLFSLVGGGDGASWHEGVSCLVDNGAVVFPWVADRAWVKDVSLLVVGPVGGVDDWQLGVDGRSLWVGLGDGFSVSCWHHERAAGDGKTGEQAGGATTERHVQFSSNDWRWTYFF